MDPINRRVLVIDDNESIHDDFHKILDPPADTHALAALEADLFGGSAKPRERFTLDSALQGEAGYRKVVAARAAGQPFALAFVDMRMPPGWDGMLTATRILADDPTIQVVICTAYADHSWEEMEQGFGAVDRVLILKKPFDNIEVRQLAQALTRKWTLTVQAQARVEDLERLVAIHTHHLAESNAQLSTLIDASPVGIISRDREGKIRIWNSAAERIFGWTATEVVGLVAPAFSDQLREESTRLVRDWLSGQRLVVEARQRRKDGREIDVSLSTAVIHGPDGAITGLITTASDITSRKLMEFQLRQAQKLESIGQLAAGIAHEINTPTQYVSDNLRFLKEGCSGFERLIEAYETLRLAVPEDSDLATRAQIITDLRTEIEIDYLLMELPQAIDHSLDGLSRVSEIVHAMKEFSHPGTREKMPYDLNRAIETTVVVSRNEWKFVADLVTDLADDLHDVPCLPSEFNQVMLNLIVNAAHAIGDVVGKDGAGGKGRITITTRRDGDWAEIRITDNGTGIPEAIRQRVFDPFFTTKEVGKGTGQGLAIARSVVVDKHQGTLDFSSDMGKGTTFIVRLPLRSVST